MSMHVFGLSPYDPEQTSLFNADMSMEFRPYTASAKLSDALDVINDRYGEFTVAPAKMMDMKGTIIDRVAFGNSPDIAQD